MLSLPPAFFRVRTGRLLVSACLRLRTPRPFSSNTPIMAHDSPSSPPVRQPSEDLGEMQWPEESLTSTIDKGGGFYPARLGETFEDGRFVLTRKLGWGGFSSVWLARDRKDSRHVAIKMLSAYASREIEAGRLGERDILRKITNAVPSHRGFQHVVRLLHEFTFESFAGRHICFVTDVSSYSVAGLQREMSDARFPLKFILRLAKHVLQGLEYLHDGCNVVHSDLKPGNLLLIPPNLDAIVMHELAEQPSTLYEIPKEIPPSELPIVPVTTQPLLFTFDPNANVRWHWIIADLGHAHLQDKHLSRIVQPFALRAPEVILGLEWGPPIDIWSLGCLMYELATGGWLFFPEAVNGVSRDVDHLADMTQRTGQEHDEAVLEQFAAREKVDNIKDALRRATEGTGKVEPIESKLNESNVYSNGAEEVAGFIRLMRSFLALDPAKRPRAKDALNDPIFEDVE